MSQRMTPTREDTGARGQRPEFSPAVDIYDQGEEIVLVADMPGVSGESIECNLDRGVLTIRGRVLSQAGPGDGALVLEEYQVGDFVRTFTLSEDIDAEGITAEMTNGVLTLHLSKSAERKPRKIPVKSG